MAKLISVVIPTCNRKIQTDQAIESVRPSCPEMFEIIVVDDYGATPYAYDQTVNLSGVPVITFRTAKNGGPGLARKLGVERSRGAVIAFLDSDDVFELSWPDALLTEVARQENSLRDSLFIAGKTLGGSVAQRWQVEFLASVPSFLMTSCVRLAVILSNPFYTPATAISKQLCSFSDSSRYCEDYFTNAMAIHKARRISVLSVDACTISRPPGTAGGLSELRRNMLSGEFSVRKSMLLHPNIPIAYRMLVPLGMIYQGIRIAAKSILRISLRN